MMDWTRRDMAGAGLGLAVAPSARQITPETPAQVPQGFAVDDRRRGLLTASVRVNGSGPYAFAVDSAANASVIASDLADSLSLRPEGEIGMHTLIARETVRTVRAERLQTGALDVPNPRLAVASRSGMGGLDGLLGIDLLSDLRLDLAFRGARRIRVSRSRRTAGGYLDGPRPTARMVRATEQRFGGLLMIEARLNGESALAIVDTGALVSIANTALARAAGAIPIVLGDRGANRVLSPTGLSAEATLMIVPNLQFAGVTLVGAPMLVGDFHTFDLWGLADRPAFLMGIDLLGQFESVAIDLGRGEVLFEL